MNGPTDDGTLPALSIETARMQAIAAAQPIFYRPERVVAALLASFAALSDAQCPDANGVANACYQHPIRISATKDVLSLRALHWPMLNLLDSAERQRRSFADAMAGAVQAARSRRD